jgi:hypothetical protein
MIWFAYQISQYLVNWCEIINGRWKHMRNYTSISLSLLWLKANLLPTSPTLRSYEVEEAYVFVYLGVAPRLEILSLWSSDLRTMSWCTLQTDTHLHIVFKAEGLLPPKYWKFDVEITNYTSYNSPQMKIRRLKCRLSLKDSILIICVNCYQSSGVICQFLICCLIFYLLYITYQKYLKPLIV